jgi:hypothetical protein
MGFRSLPAGGSKTSFLAFDLGRCVASRLLGIAKPSGFWRLVGLPFSKFGKTRLRLAEGSRLELWEPAYVGREFDELWTRTRGRWANTNVRDSAAIRWQLADPDVPKKLAAFRAGERLAGYAIFKSTQWRSLPVLDCVDFWCDPNHEAAVLAAAVRFALDYGTKHDFTLAAFPHFNRTHGEQLHRLGLFQYSFATRRAYALGADRFWSRMIAKNSWFAGLQGDAGTSP